MSRAHMRTALALTVIALAPAAPRADDAAQRLVEHVRSSPRFNDPRGAFTYHGLHVVVLDARGNVAARVDRDDLVLKTDLDLESAAGRAALRDLLAIANGGASPASAPESGEKPIAWVEVADGMALGYGTYR